MKQLILALVVSVFASNLSIPAIAVELQPSHGIAMHGKLKHGANFTHFSYVNPEAEKGGQLRLGIQGSFDSLNPLIVRGQPAAGLREYVFESLMARALDEPFSLYGHIAKSVVVPDDRSSITFILRQTARFSDGKPITANDVIFSHELLRKHGRPSHRSHYSKVAKVERLGDYRVRFQFKPGTDREIPLIMGLMPILPRHVYKPDSFEQTTLKKPIGSGPYVVDRMEPGKIITYKRNPDYWARDLPSTRGRFNFDEIRYDYYRDGAAIFEAFKKGLECGRPDGAR